MLRGYVLRGSMLRGSMLRGSMLLRVDSLASWWSRFRGSMLRGSVLRGSMLRGTQSRRHSRRRERRARSWCVETARCCEVRGVASLEELCKSHVHLLDAALLYSLARPSLTILFMVELAFSEANCISCIHWERSSNFLSQPSIMMSKSLAVTMLGGVGLSIRGSVFSEDNFFLPFTVSVRLWVVEGFHLTHSELLLNPII